MNSQASITTDTEPDLVYTQYQTQQQENLSLPLSISTSTVTNINGIAGPTVTFSGGTTGLSFVPGGSTITLAGTLVIADGGTGSTTAAGARASLVVAKSGANADLNTFSALTGSAGWAAWTGTADKTTHDTATATLLNVAQALKGLLDTLLASGVLKP